MKNLLANSPVRMIAICVTVGACHGSLSQASAYQISGTVKYGTSRLSNVTVTANNGGSQDATDGNGYFQVFVPAGWTGAVTLTKTGYTITPWSCSFSNVTSNRVCPDFIATISLSNVPPLISQGTIKSLSTSTNAFIDFQLSATNTDAPADALVWSISSPAKSGIAKVTAGSPSVSGGLASFRYTPNTNFSGVDSFGVSVNDGRSGGIDIIQVNATVSGPVQQPPPIPSGTGGRTLYVAVTGSDTAAGTATAPFKTIQRAADVALPGDTLIIRGGTYNSGATAEQVPVLLISKNGTATAPITFKAAPGELVILDGKSGLTTILIEVRGSYINLEGFELKNAKHAAITVIDDNQNGVINVHHVNVRFCYAHNHNYDETFIGGAFRAVGPVEYVVFEDCMSHDNVIGFEFRESPTQRAETMSVPPTAGNIGYSTTMAESQWGSWSGWVGYATRYCTIRRCISYNNRHLLENSDGVCSRYAIQCTFEDNISFRNADDNYDMLGATRCTIRRNIGFSADPSNTADGDGNGLKVGVRGGLGNVVYNNIMFDNRRGGIDMVDTEWAQVYNNTCYNNGWAGIFFEAGRATTGGAIVLNNICKKNPAGDLARATFTRITRGDYNCVSDASGEDYSLPPGSHGLISTNPIFLNEALAVSTTFASGLTIPQKLTFIRNQVNAKLGLKLGSPCINTGVTISGIIGAILGTGPDRGAVESR